MFRIIYADANGVKEKEEESVASLKTTISNISNGLVIKIWAISNGVAYECTQEILTQLA